MPRDKDFKQTLCANSNGFSLYASVRCTAEDRHALERPCGCITRPVLANERVQINAAGQVVPKLKTPWRDGTTHLGDVAAGVHAAAGSAGFATGCSASANSERPVSGEGRVLPIPA